jgi:hypothetical protein
MYCLLAEVEALEVETLQVDQVMVALAEAATARALGDLGHRNKVSTAVWAKLTRPVLVAVVPVRPVEKLPPALSMVRRAETDYRRLLPAHPYTELVVVAVVTTNLALAQVEPEGLAEAETVEQLTVTLQLER